MSMRQLFFIALTLFSSITSAKVFQGTTRFLTDDMNPAPSCDVVKFRLQEYVLRSKEAANVLEWYSPVWQRPDLNEKLVEILRRMPYFYEDRLYEHLTVQTDWAVDREDVRDYLLSHQTGVELVSGQFNWSDPFNGLFPDGATVEVNSSFGVIRLEQKMSFEAFCLGDNKIKLNYTFLRTVGDDMIGRMKIPKYLHLESEYNVDDL